MLCIIIILYLYFHFSSSPPDLLEKKWKSWWLPALSWASPTVHSWKQGRACRIRTVCVLPKTKAVRTSFLPQGCANFSALVAASAWLLLDLVCETPIAFTSLPRDFVRQWCWANCCKQLHIDRCDLVGQQPLQPKPVSWHFKNNAIKTSRG